MREEYAWKSNHLLLSLVRKGGGCVGFFFVVVGVGAKSGLTKSLFRAQVTACLSQSILSPSPSLRVSRSMADEVFFTFLPTAILGQPAIVPLRPSSCPETSFKLTLSTEENRHAVSSISSIVVQLPSFLPTSPLQSSAGMLAGYFPQ